jgi:hypothetical protein
MLTAAMNLDEKKKMLDTVRRLWQTGGLRPCTPRQPADRSVVRNESPMKLPRPGRAEFTFTSVDVGNYA